MKNIHFETAVKLTSLWVSTRPSSLLPSEVSIKETFVMFLREILNQDGYYQPTTEQLMALNLKAKMDKQAST